MLSSLRFRWRLALRPGQLRRECSCASAFCLVWPPNHFPRPRSSCPIPALPTMLTMLTPARLMASAGAASARPPISATWQGPRLTQQLGRHRLPRGHIPGTERSCRLCCSASASSEASPGAAPADVTFSDRPELPQDVLSQACAAKVVYAAEPALGHQMEGHPECNERVSSILSTLQTAGLTTKGRPGEVLELEDFAWATPDDIATVHHPKYVKALERAIDRAADEGMVYLEGSGPTYATPTTLNETLRAAGAGLSLVDILLSAAPPGLAQAPARAPPVGFAIVRPPGHHAVREGPMGFCVVDHIAVAARYAQFRGLKRVFIVDFDVHHGNGTHDLFFNDPNVFFLSTHQDGSFPGTGKFEEVGEGPGEGATLNLPLPGGAGDAAMGAVVDQVIAPAIARFKPDIILVSAGYDAHYMDPLAGLQFLTSTYHRVVAQLHQLAKQHCAGRMLLFLEGGYHLKALPGSVEDSIRALLGEGPAAAKGLDVLEAIYEEPLDAVRDAIQKCRSIHLL